VEYLPWPLRNLTLRFRSARLRKTDQARARSAHAVRIDLRPVSVWQVRLYLRLLLGRTARIAALSEVSPGIVRMAVERIGNGPFTA
jgi:hypothetical protein